MSFFTSKYTKNSQPEINNYIHQNINSQSKIKIRKYLLSKGAKHGQIDQGFQESLDHHSNIKSELQTEKLKPLKTQNQSNNSINYDTSTNNQELKSIMEEFQNNPQITQNLPLSGNAKQLSKLFIILFIGFIILTFILPLFIGLMTLTIGIK